MVSKKRDSKGKDLVTIICRSIGRPTLKQALNSIRAQSYTPIEVILVNSTGKSLVNLLPNDLDVTELNQKKLLTRPEAANLGMDSANGHFFLFLDDDDYISSNHIANLMSKVLESSSFRAIYCGVQRVTSQGKLLNHIYSTEFDPDLLMRDNYIPIHSMLFEKSLVVEGCRFDTQLEIYEDWDFWLQLSQKTTPIHIPAITAFYRSGGDSETMHAEDAERFNSDSRIGRARAQIFEKWKSQWTGEQVNKLIGISMRADLSNIYHELDSHHKELLMEHVVIKKQYEELGEKHEKLGEKLEKLGGKHEKLKLENKALAIKLNEEINFLRRSVKESVENNSTLKIEIQRKEETERHLRLHESQLELALEEIISSNTWRLTGAFRRVGTLVKRGLTMSRALEIKKNEAAKFIEKAATLPPPKERIKTDGGDVASIPLIQDCKIEYDAKAKSQLSKLLKSTERLVFPDTKDIELSIIIVLYNQAHLGLLCFKSLLHHADVTYELVIIDNASTDKTGDLLALIDNARIIRNNENLGFLRAVNQGSEIAKGKYILLLNNDAVIQKKSLSRALSTIENDQEIGAVGAKIKLTDGTLQEAGSIIWNDGSCIGYGRGENPNDPKFMFKREVDYCSGAFLLFRKVDFVELGSFDIDFAPAYYEESDFCIRLQKAGLKVVYNPCVEIVHYEFASSENVTNALSLQEKNRKTLLAKHKAWLADKYPPEEGYTLIARSTNKFSNILLIDDRVPHPALGSGYPRCAQILNTLAAFNYNVTLYPLQFPSGDWKSSYETLDDSIEIIFDEGQSGLEGFLRARKGFFQHIIVSRVHNMEVFKTLTAENQDLLSNVDLVYDAEALTASREIIRRTLYGKGVGRDEEASMMKDEMEKCSIANSVVAVSEQEARVYRSHGIKNVHVLGHKMTVRPGRNDFESREGLLFVGALRDEGSPNVDSLLWFSINVFPLIEKDLPNIKIYVVGDLGAPSLLTIQKDNISFLGKVENLDEIYNRCRVFIAPTRFSAGIPHKVHEAAASGIPCVATELLAKQLQWDDGKELLVGTTPGMFASQCVRLYKDQGLWRDIRAHGLHAIGEDCSEAVFQSNLKSIFDQSARAIL